MKRPTLAFSLFFCATLDLSWIYCLCLLSLAPREQWEPSRSYSGTDVKMTKQSCSLPLQLSTRLALITQEPTSPDPRGPHVCTWACAATEHMESSPSLSGLGKADPGCLLSFCCHQILIDCLRFWNHGNFPAQHSWNKDDSNHGRGKKM